VGHIDFRQGERPAYQVLEILDCVPVTFGIIPTLRRMRAFDVSKVVEVVTEERHVTKFLRSRFAIVLVVAGMCEHDAKKCSIPGVTFVHRRVVKTSLAIPAHAFYGGENVPAPHERIHAYCGGEKRLHIPPARTRRDLISIPCPWQAMID